MNKINKAFTLIELLAVMVILALLALIAIPSVSKQMENSKDSLYNTQISNIKEAAVTWGADHIFKLPEGDKCITLTLGYLKDLGYIDINVVNPKTGEKFDDDMTFINITKNNNSYIYEVKTEGNKCELVDESI